MSEVQDWNRKIIEEFRANEGQVGGPFAGAPVLLLHTTGAKTGQGRTSSVRPKRLRTRFIAGGRARGSSSTTLPSSRSRPARFLENLPDPLP